MCRQTSTPGLCEGWFWRHDTRLRVRVRRAALSAVESRYGELDMAMAGGKKQIGPACYFPFPKEEETGRRAPFAQDGSGRYSGQRTVKIRPTFSSSRATCRSGSFCVFSQLRKGRFLWGYSSGNPLIVLFRVIPNDLDGGAHGHARSHIWFWPAAALRYDKKKSLLLFFFFLESPPPSSLIAWSIKNKALVVKGIICDPKIARMKEGRCLFFLEMITSIRNNVRGETRLCYVNFLLIFMNKTREKTQPKRNRHNFPQCSW